MESLTPGDDVLLRRPSLSDAPGLLAVHGDPLAYLFDPQERHVDLGYTERWLQPILQHWTDHGFGYWTVLVPLDWWPAGPPGSGPADAGRVVAGMGGIRFHRCAGVQVLNVYYRLAPPVQGRRLAGRLVDAAVEWAAVNLTGTDLVVRTRPQNAVARHVARRAGFVDEGIDPEDAAMVQLRLRSPAASR
ncbi:GNAT family N-acetyltransferase [Nakamurella lactea]|jgi:RimJ/RimL family protein N-acetyltransferase|uniref:GNAT family N-acetyltransferase n=1 Tax=Nakamurella lactea TaxID=459515 RepID=UPI0004218DA2|nr:GNAT family protein [Nakamurella lactea]